VLVLALLITLVILGVGLTAMFLSSSGMKVSGNISRRQEALSATEAGVERALALVKTVADWDTLLDGSTCNGTIGAGDHDIPAGAPGPANTAKGAILCDPNNGGVPLKDVPVYEGGSTVATAVPDLKNVRYTVYVRNDNPEVRTMSNNWLDDEDMRVVLRVEGTARDNLSFFAVEVVAAVPQGGGAQNPCPYGQAGGCDGANTNAMKASIAKPSP
jgi:hypothetical protein